MYTTGQRGSGVKPEGVECNAAEREKEKEMREGFKKGRQVSLS
jgi:hypothetical protein